MSRLAAVLRLRSLAERQAAGALARGERDLQQARRRVAEREAAARLPVGPPALRPQQLRVLELQRLAGHELVEQAQSTAEQADATRQERMRAWSLASTSRRSAERLVERRDAAAARAARAAADRALDEIAIIRWRAP